MQNNEEIYDDDVKFVLSEWGCLHSVLSNYGINVDHIKGKVGEPIVEDFLELMCECGYIGKAEDKED